MKIRNEPLFYDPKMFFLRFKSRLNKAPLQNLSDFFSQEHFEKIVKGQNQAKNLTRPVAVDWRCVVGNFLLDFGPLRIFSKIFRTTEIAQILHWGLI